MQLESSGTTTKALNTFMVSMELASTGRNQFTQYISCRCPDVPLVALDELIC